MSKDSDIKSLRGNRGIRIDSSPTIKKKVKKKVKK